MTAQLRRDNFAMEVEAISPGGHFLQNLDVRALVGRLQRGGRVQPHHERRPIGARRVRPQHRDSRRDG